MKKILSLVALFSLAVPAVAAVAEIAGVSVPSVFSLELGLSAFVSAFALMLFSADYAPKRAYRVKTRARVLWPAKAAFIATTSSRAPFAAVRTPRQSRTFRPMVKL